MKKLLIALFLAFLVSCSEEPCEEVICEWGDCVDGTCFCIEGYEGDLCQREISPSKITFTGLNLLYYDQLHPDGVSTWDPGDVPDSHADIRIKFEKDGQLLWANPFIAHDHDPTEQIDFEISPPIEIEDVDGFYSIEIGDNDDGFFYEIAFFNFTPYQENFDFPAPLNFQSGQTRIQLELEYEW